MARTLIENEERVAQRVSETLVTILEQAKADGFVLSFRKTNAHSGDLIVEEAAKARGWTTSHTAMALTNAFTAFSAIPGDRTYLIAQSAQKMAAVKLGLLEPR